MIKGAIFDFDGTLFDSMYIWDSVGTEYLKSVGKTAKSDFKKTVNTMSLHQAAEYCKCEYNLPFSIDEIIAGYNKIVEDFYFNTAKPKAGVVEFLDELRKKDVKMCIATATDKYMIEAALKRCNMRGFFSEIFTCSDVGHGKDEPVIFRTALEHLGTQRCDTVIFEDACHAVKTAKADGFYVIGVYDSYEENYEQVKNLSDCWIKDFLHTEDFWKFASLI